MNKCKLVLLLSVMGVGAAGSDAYAISYMSREQAIHWALPEADEIKEEGHVLDPDHKRSVEKELGWKLKKNKFIFYRGMQNKAVLGFAFLDDEIGKYQPITFVIALDPKGRVRDVEVMIYRESIGHEIKGRKFLNQFRGKDAQSPLRLGEDIDALTGATLSARSAARSVRKALVLFKEFYGGTSG